MYMHTISSLDSSLRQALFSSLSPQHIAPAIFLALVLKATATSIFLLELACHRAKRVLETERLKEMEDVGSAWP